MANVSSSKRPATTSFNNINDHSDILLEILTLLDDRSLAVSACVCRLWHSHTQNEAFWEMVCFRQCYSSYSQRQVVAALGGYKKLYMVCVRRRRAGCTERGGWSREEVQMWLSLFCVEYYERFGDGLMMARKSETMPSLMFLCGSVNV